MEKKRTLTKILAIVGTVLAWFPILAPILLSAVMLIQERRFLFDYLMPMELFFFTLIGGALLIWAALWAQSRQKLLGWSLGIAAGLFFGSQALAVATGLASGAAEPSGLWWSIVIAMMIVYTLTLVLIATGGVLLLGDLFKPPQTLAKSH
jgi:hypothetical protein